jgi:hypothetical protein
MWTMPSSDGRAFVSALERLGYGSEPLLAAPAFAAATSTTPMREYRATRWAR